MILQSAWHPREFSAWHLDTICNLCCEQKSEFSLCANCRPNLLEHDRPPRATDVKSAVVDARCSLRSALCFLHSASPPGRALTSSGAEQQARSGGRRAERSSKPSVGGSTSARQQRATAAGHTSQTLARGAVPRVDVRVSEIVTASERNRGTHYQLSGYSVGIRAVRYPCRMARCHRLSSCDLSPDLL